MHFTTKAIQGSQQIYFWLECPYFCLLLAWFSFANSRPSVLNFLKFFSITRTIYSNSERSEEFLVTEYFSCSLRFLIYNKLEQLEFKLEKNIGIQKHAGKVRKNTHFFGLLFLDSAHKYIFLLKIKYDLIKENVSRFDCTALFTNISVIQNFI